MSMKAFHIPEPQEAPPPVGARVAGGIMGHDGVVHALYPVDLNVAEIECLAKAGVKIELAGPVRVQSSPPPVAGTASDHLISMARDRWRMSMEAKYNDRNIAPVFFNDPLVAAVRHGDKVHVFAHGHGEPEIIVDDVCMYPSDALLAKLHLMMENSK